MTDIKTNIRDGAYVALGAAALGMQHLSKKSDGVKARVEPVIKDVTPKIKVVSDRVYEKISPIAENVYGRVSTRVLPVASAAAEKVSTNLKPVASTVVKQVSEKSGQAISSGKKIADEAKKRVS